MASAKFGWKTLAPLAVWLVLYLIPVPAGLQPNQWHYFAIFAAVMFFVGTRRFKRELA